MSTSGYMECARLTLRPGISSLSRRATDSGCLDRSDGQGQRKALTWNTRPLCRHYLAVVFESQLVAVWKQDAACDLEARWAIGVVADGQYEVLGMWWESVPGMFNWEEICADLTLRGVEKIAFVGGNEPNVLGEAMRTSYPFAKTLALLQLEPRCTLSPCSLRIIRSGEDAAQELRQSLSRAVDRHGCFDDRSEAVSFVVGVLERADSRFALPRSSLYRGNPDRVESTFRKNGFRPKAVGL